MNLSHQNNNTKSKVLKWIFISTLISAIIGYTIFAIQLFVYDYEVWGWFPDFAEVLSYCTVSNPYDGSSGITSIYPPISYLIFLPLSLICRHDIKALIAGEINLLTISNRPSFILTYLIYFLMTISLIVWIIAKLTKLKGKNLFYLIGIIVLSGPLYFVFNRGNIILTTFLLSLAFFWLFQSEKRWHRELALICLSLAIAMKIYPVIIVLVLFKDRRWLDIVKTGIYAMLFVFVPFVFVSGNIIDNIKCIFDSYDNLINFGGFFISASTSFEGISIAFAHFLSTHFGINLSHGLHIIAMILKFLLAGTSVITLFLCYKSARKFEVATIAIGCYILFQSVSYAYVFIFAFILFALFLNSLKIYHKTNIIFYSILFGVIFFTIPFLFRNCIIQFFALVTMVLKAIIDLWIEHVKTVKQINANEIRQ